MLISLLGVALARGAEPAAAPKTFKAFLDAFPGPSYIVELRGTTIHYEEYRRRIEPPGRLVHDGSTTAKITPTAEQWREFRRALDDINIWRWLPEYDNPSVADGITWRFEVSFSDRALKTQGCNNYPDEKGALGRDNEKFPPDISPTPTFDRLLVAIGKLIGDRPFKYRSDLAEGARAVLARLKAVSAPNSKREFMPFAFVRRLQPEKYAGQWTEHPVPMPGTRSEPDLRERVLRDFRQELPRQVAAKMIDAYLVIYEDSGTVYLVAHKRDGSESRFRAVRPENLHELTLEDFHAE